MRSDWALLLAARGLRAFGFGFAAVLVGLHLEHAGLSPVLIGLTVGLGLASASLTGLGAVVFAVRFGRRATLAVTGLLMAVTGLDLALALATPVTPAFISRRAESDVRAPAFGALRRRETTRVLAGLAALFALDSFAGGFVVNAVISYWLHVRFGASPQVLGPVFAALAFLQSISFEVSARLSTRIGLINTMVFTHLPSNVLLLFVAFSPTLAWAVGLLLARFLLSQMDVPARQAYVVSIVPREDRAAALAVTGAVRGVAQAFGPVLSGVAIGAAAFGLPFFAGGGLKIGYDLALFAAFRNRRADHEI